jgi:hypothetical protein
LIINTKDDMLVFPPVTPAKFTLKNGIYFFELNITLTKMPRDMTGEPLCPKDASNTFLATCICVDMHCLMMWSDEADAIPFECVSVPPVDFDACIGWNVADGAVGCECCGEAYEVAEEGTGMGDDLGAEL